MAKKNTIGSRYIKLNFHKKHIWTYVVVNVAVQFCASWQHWSKFRIWNWLSSRKHWIRIESTNNSIFLFFMWLSCQYSYFIHVMKQHYVHAGRLGNLTLEKKSQILANGTMQQLSYGNSVCYFLETRNTSSYSNNRSWPLSNDNLFQTLLYDDV